MRLFKIFLSTFFIFFASKLLAVPDVSVVFVLDESGSMSGNDFLLETQGFSDSLNNLPLNGSVEISAIGFDSKIDLLFERISLDSTSKLTEVQSYLKNNTQGRGGTLTSKAIDAASALLLLSSASSKIICLATDGGPNNANAAKVSADSSKSQGIILSTIGVGVSVGKDFLDSIDSNPPAAIATDFSTFLTVVKTDCIGEIKSILHSPIAVDDSVSTNQETSVAINVLSNDSDPDNDSLSITTFDTTSVKNGKIVESSSGILTYTPAQGISGTDTFHYTVSDGNGGTDQGTVTVNIISTNTNPIAVDDTVDTNQDKTVIINVLANDSDPDNDSLLIATFDVTSVNNGKIVENNGVLSYTPAQGIFGTDTFHYTVSDGNGGTDQGTVTVNINALPTVKPDNIKVNQGKTATFNVLENDTDIDSALLSVTLDKTQSDKGGKISNNNGVIQYTPPSDEFFGIDSFEYIVTDDDGGTSTGTVTININANPSAGNDTTVDTKQNTPITINILDKISDLDQSKEQLIITIDDKLITGKIENNNGVLLYTPLQGFVGSESFTYTITDENGGTDAAQVTINIINTAPTVIPIGNVSMKQDEPSVINILASDIDNDTLSITTNNGFSKEGGKITIAANKITYTPKQGYTGIDSFEYLVKDGKGGQVSDIVTLNVILLVATDDELSIKQGEVLVMDNLLGNDIDSGNTISISSFTEAKYADIKQTADNILVYTPNANSNIIGSDSFSYTIKTSDGLTATATVVIKISSKDGKVSGGAAGGSFNLVGILFLLITFLLTVIRRKYHINP